jgi:hypothetical protein
MAKITFQVARVVKGLNSPQTLIVYANGDELTRITAHHNPVVMARLLRDMANDVEALATPVEPPKDFAEEEKPSV